MSATSPCSNYEAWRRSEAMWISDSLSLARFECYQPQYSLVVRDIEQKLIPLCQLKELGVVVWSPLAGGFLSGKYRPGERQASGSRLEEGWAYPQTYFGDTADSTLETLVAVSAELGKNASAGGVAVGAGSAGNHVSHRRGADG